MNRTPRLALALALALALSACSSDEERPDDTAAAADPGPDAAEPAPAASENSTAAADAAFEKDAAAVYDAYIALNPSLAVELGYHQFDGQVSDVSAAGIAKDTQTLKDLRAQLLAHDVTALSGLRQVEHAVMLGQIDKDLFQIEELKLLTRNPLVYRLEVSSYISRDYAPVKERANAIIKVAKAAPAFYAEAQKNLDEVMPKSWVQIAMLMTTGTVDFVKNDVPAALGTLEPAQQKELDAALQGFVTALEGYAAFLQARMEKADDNYALGEEMFLKMLKLESGLDISLADLTRVAEEDLARNLALMDAAAKEIDPNKTTAEVVAQVLADKPAKDAVLAEATAQCTALRKFLVEKNVVSIPFEDKAVLKETPPFLRFNFAFLDGAGPFEEKPLPSFYYVTPPDPTWPEDKQLAYVPGKTDLLGTSIHEVWPGHFLHGLHKKKLDSKILKSFWNYAQGEGWAHYTEEMMVLDAGYGENAPEYRVGMLVNALLRNVRFLSAIGLHTGGMTTEQSFKMFQDKAFQDEGNAGQQAARGTFDPMYLSYTVGKLMIRKLREDYKAKLGDAYSLQKFHDAFLAFGSAPVPAIRVQLLGQDAGPAL